MLRSRSARLVSVILAVTLGALIVIPAQGDDEPPAVTTPRTPPQLHAPPLFAVPGQAREVSAYVTGTPTAVRLLVQSTDGERTVPMRPASDFLYTATIPGDAVRGGDLTYSVAADYPEKTNHSEPGHLVVLDNIAPSTAKLTSTTGETLATFELGDKSDQLGVRGGQDSARELPPSFTIDERRGQLLVLDAVKSRVVTADMKGRIRKKTPVPGGTATASDLVLGSNGARLILDQVRDEVIELSEQGSRSFKGVGIADRTRGARLAFDAESSTIFASDPIQGRFVPVVTKGRRTTKSERRTQSADGVPTALGALAAEVDGNSVVFGLDGGRGVGFRVSLPDRVLDVSEVAVDGNGVLFGLVGTVKDDGAAMHLVQVDPAAGASVATPVGVSLAGDVVRRLTALNSGVALMEGTTNSISLVRFDRF